MRTVPSWGGDHLLRVGCLRPGGVHASFPSQVSQGIVNVKVSLFKTYCANLYCSQFWLNSRSCDLTKLRTAYNNSFRRLMKYDYRCSASGMFVNNNVLSFAELRRKSISNFIDRLKRSENTLIKKSLATNHVLFSPLWLSWYSSLYI